MARMVESTHALLEQLAYQMSQNVDWRRLGGPIALAKVQATKTMEFCAREARPLSLSIHTLSRARTHSHTHSLTHAHTYKHAKRAQETQFLLCCVMFL